MMAGTTPPSAFEEACAWAARIRDPAFEDWDAHVLWLEAHPSHPDLYRRAAIALSDGLTGIDDVLRRGDRLVANDDDDDDARPAPRAWQRRGWIGAAAALAACFAYLLVPHATPAVPDEVIATAPGQTRSVRLQDGTVLTLNGDTVVRLLAANPRRAYLDRGEVFARIAHDPRRRFDIATAQGVFRDIGTSFDVRYVAGETRLAVAEGIVAFDPDGAGIRIAAGRSLSIVGDRAVLSSVPAAAIGSWRSGRLYYRDATLAQVGDDLAMSLGQPVEAAPAIRDRRFSGVLALDGRPEQVISRLAGMAQISAARRGAAWRLRASAAFSSPAITGLPWLLRSQDVDTSVGALRRPHARRQGMEEQDGS